MSIARRSARHDLVDLDYEARVVGALLADFANASAVTRSLRPRHLGHPHFSAILAAIRSIESRGVTPTIPAVRERLIEREFSAVVPCIAECLDAYVPSADSCRLHLFAGRIRALADLRGLLALADRVDLILRDRHLDRSMQIEATHKALREAFAEFATESGRAAA